MNSVASSGNSETSAGRIADCLQTRDALLELAPLLRRALALDPDLLARIRVRDGTASVLVRLPVDVLVARTVAAARLPKPCDVVVRADEAVAWLDSHTQHPPSARDAQWRTASPPATGWRRIDTVPDDIVRGLVRSGALALQQAGAREGVPGARPRADVADALLDSIVLTVTADGAPTAEINLRCLSALTRMGFLPTGSHIAVDVAGRWTRIAAAHGSVYVERAGLRLAVR
jgi:hypothetical protein